MTTLSVVIPAYNEERGIAEIVCRVLAIRDKLTRCGVAGLELIVVDDGSHDHTPEIVAGLALQDPGLRLVCHARNEGYGAALKTGFSQAKGDLIGFLDADGTYPPEFFPHLCEAALNGSELVIGSRMAGAESQMPFTRRLGNRFFAGLLSLIGRQQVSDTASGMRVFKRSVLERVCPLPDGLNLTPVMSTRAIHEGVRMAEVPIPYHERVGRSKLSVVRDGQVFLQSIIWTVLTYNPVRIFGLLGLVGLGIAGLVALGFVIARLSGITEIGAWGIVALYIAMVSAVTGVSLYSLGATFNYLVSIFYKHPIRRQGLFGRPIFTPSLDHYFGWFGLAGLLGGLALSVVTLALGIGGWSIDRLWLYLLGAAMLILISIQLMLFWLLMRVLEELNHREITEVED